MSSIQWFPVADVQSAEYKSAISIYHEAFPAYERHPDEAIEHRIKTGHSRMFVGKVAGETVFMSILFDLPGTDFMFLDYMAGGAAARGKGYGSQFLAYMVSELGAGRYIILESEDPAFGDNREQREQRIRFYLKNGGYILPGVPYLLPPLDGTVPTEMLLIAIPQPPEGYLNKELIVRLIKTLYREIYHRVEGDELLEKILAGMKG